VEESRRSKVAHLHDEQVDRHVVVAAVRDDQVGVALLGSTNC